MFHIGASYLAFCVTFVITTLCVAWAYFAALICASIARRRGLSVKRPALHGAIYATTLFLPWQHLTRQMRGEPIRRENIRDAYYYTYALAALVLAAHIFFIFADPYPSYSRTLIEDLVEFIVAAIIGALAFIAGLVSLSRAKKRLDELQEQRQSPNAIDLPDRSYIAPFAWAWASMLISSATWFYRTFGYLIWELFINR